MWQLGWCPICGGVVVMELEQSGAVIAMYPARLDAWAVRHLPPAVASIWAEAGTVFGIGAFRMAVVACGRTLEQAAIERSVDAKTLQKRIEKMQDDGLITREFRNAMDYVRVIRNVGAHAGQEVTRETADGTLRFTQQTLRLLFEVPGELQRLTGHPPELDDGEPDDSDQQ
jgi:hypothetical protein